MESLTKASCVTTLNKDYKAMLHFDSYISWYCNKLANKYQVNSQTRTHVAKETSKKTNKPAKHGMSDVVWIVLATMSCVVFALKLFFGWWSLYMAFLFAKLLAKRGACFSIDVAIHSSFLVLCVTIVCLLDILETYLYA